MEENQESEVLLVQLPQPRRRGAGGMPATRRKMLRRRTITKTVAKPQGIPLKGLVLMGW